MSPWSTYIRIACSLCSQHCCSHTRFTFLGVVSLNSHLLLCKQIRSPCCVNHWHEVQDLGMSGYPTQKCLHNGEHRQLPARECSPGASGMTASTPVRPGPASSAQQTCCSGKLTPTICKIQVGCTRCNVTSEMAVDLEIR